MVWHYTIFEQVRKIMLNKVEKSCICKAVRWITEHPYPWGNFTWETKAINQSRESAHTGFMWGVSFTHSMVAGGYFMWEVSLPHLVLATLCGKFLFEKKTAIATETERERVCVRQRQKQTRQMKNNNWVMLPKVEVNVPPQAPQGHSRASSNRSWNKDIE